MTSAPCPLVSSRTAVDEVAVAIVDAVIEPEGLQPLELVVARGGGEHGRTGALGELDGRDADATGARMHQDGLARLQPAELEQAVVGGAERDRHAGAVLEIERRRGAPTC